MSTFGHDALLYDGRDAFVEHLLPFVADGIECGEPVLAVTSAANAEALREALGPAAAGVDWRDSAAWYASPGRAFRQYADYVAARANGRRVRVIGEPVWPVDWTAGVREWARYESVLNVAFADAPAWIVCPYDAASLPDAVLEHARHTHPTLHERGGRSEHGAYVDPADFWATLDEPATLQPPAHARRLPLTADLAAVRATVAREAAAANVRDDRIPEVVAAVHELAINALTHGGGAATLATWVTDGEFVCEIEDEGPGLAERYVGYRVPGPDETRGRGVWLARQFCDLVEARSGRDGTRVRVYVRRA